MSGSAIRWCIMRHVEVKGTCYTPWPVGRKQIAFAAGAPGGVCDRPSVPCSPMYDLDAWPTLCDSKAEAEKLAKELDRPTCRHEVADLSSLRCDVWLLDHYNGSYHIQGLDLPFDEARLLYLAAVGFAAHHRAYWSPNWFVVAAEVRGDWRLPGVGVDLRAGRLDYDPSQPLTLWAERAKR